MVSPLRKERFDMRVLLGTDGSPSSDQAASLVANLAWPMGSTIEVVTAYPGAYALFSMPGVVMAADVIQETEDAMEAEARRMAIVVARRIAAPDITVETKVVLGRAATAIIDEASAIDADLIVLGNRGRGPFESAVLGSVSAEVVDHSSRPVLVARRERVNRILVGEDGSASAALATDLVRRWPILHGARIRVLSVADIDPQGNVWLQAAARGKALDASLAKVHQEHEALAARTAAGLRAAGLQAESEVEDGGPAHRLVETSVNWDADLIVVGTHGQTGLKRLLFGSVARAVLYHAPCSVLIVPGPHRQSATAATQ
jgi:nucleotide-binding universal stress UspA family protein